MVVQQGRLNGLWVSWMLLTCGLLQPLTAADAIAAEGSGQPAAGASTRFFIDEGYFLEGDTEILRAYISASDGRMTISGESSAAFLSVKGYYSPETWDVYWTIRQACHMAYKHMQPHQKVNCIPGISAMSLKRNFVSTWQKAYGERAFDHMPRSYLIPEQYWLWRSHLLASASTADRKWVLKANVHRGKGVSVVPQHEALSQALTHKHEPFSTSGSTDSDSVAYHNVLVQSYLQQQLVIAGRSSYIRVWLLVTSIQPLRAYLFDGGFAIFGKQKGAQAAAGAGSGGSSGSNNTASSSSSNSKDDLIVNLWMQDRNSSSIWSLQHLRDYLNAHPESVLPLPDPQQQQQQQEQQEHTPARKTGRLLLQANQGSNASITSSRGSKVSGGSKQQQQQRRTFADAWQDMQASASLVLAAALPAMRAAAAETGAPDQGTFEYFGLDFVFDAHLRPWMLEVNAIPSMARRKKSDCSGKAATASCKLTTGGSPPPAPAPAAAAIPSSNSSGKGSSPAAAAAAAATAGEDDFDAQKEQFVHDMLAVLGLPVDATNSSSNSSSNATAVHSPSDAAGLLRMAAAAAAAAGIRSATAPPSSATKQSSSSSSSSSSQVGVADVKTPGSSNSSRGRLLLSHQSGAADPQGLMPQADQQQQQQQEEQQWWNWLHNYLQPRRQQQQRRQLMRHARRHRQHHPQHHRPHSSSSKQSSGANSTTTANSSGGSPSSSDQRVTGFKGVAGLQWSGPPPDIKQLPAPLQKLLCTGTTAAGSSSGSSDGFQCISCLTADDLAALAAAEGELQRAGRFVPVHDLITAHSLNQGALQEASASAAATSAAVAAVPGSVTSDTPAAAGAAAGGGGKGADGAAAGLGLPADGAGTHIPADSYLSENPSVWQKLCLAWKGMSQGHVGVRDLAIMKYYTTESQVHADTALRLQRVDYVMSAWLRVRREEGCAGQQDVECVVSRLKLLSSKCYLP